MGERNDLPFLPGGKYTSGGGYGRLEEVSCFQGSAALAGPECETLDFSVTEGWLIWY